MHPPLLPSASCFSAMWWNHGSLTRVALFPWSPNRMLHSHQLFSLFSCLWAPIWASMPGSVHMYSSPIFIEIVAYKSRSWTSCWKGNRSIHLTKSIRNLRQIFKIGMSWWKWDVYSSKLWHVSQPTKAKMVDMKCKDFKLKDTKANNDSSRRLEMLWHSLF